MDERRLEQALSELKPPDESPEFFERLSTGACVEYEALARRLRLRSAVVRSVGAAAGVAACWVLAFGSPFVGQASGSPRISLAALKIVDRTFLCHTQPESLPVTLDFSNYIERTNTPVVVPGSMGVSSGFSRNLVAVQGGPGATAELVFVNKAYCKTSKAFVPLSRKGLPDSPTRYSTGFACPLVHRALVRVRSVNDGPTVVASFVAVRKEHGGPVSFASLDRSGQGAIYASAGCSKP